MGWEIVFIFLAFWYAMKAGGTVLRNKVTDRRQAKAERKAHRSQLVTEAIEKGVAPKAAKEAAELAARSAVTVSTWAAVRIAAKDAWINGWRDGRERGEELREAAAKKANDENRERTRGDGLCIKVVDRRIFGKFTEKNPHLTFCGKPVKSESRLCPEHDEERSVRQELLDKGLCVRIVGEARIEGELVLQYCQQPAKDGLCDRHRPEPVEQPEAQDWPTFCPFHFAVTAKYRELAEKRLCRRETDHTECPVGHQVPIFCEQAVTRDDSLLCDDHQPAIRPPTNDPADSQTEAAPPNKEHQTMPVETGAVGGEILTKEQFEAAMKAIVTEETAEIEDAQGDLKRAQEHIKQIEVMAASLSSAEIDQATVVAVRAFIDGSSTRLQDASQRVSNAEVRKTSAEQALKTLQGSRQNAFYTN